MKTINKRDTVYYTRVFPETGTYDLCDLVVRTVMDSWFCGVDKKDERAYLLGFNEIDENVNTQCRTKISANKRRNIL